MTQMFNAPRRFPFFSTYCVLSSCLGLISVHLQGCEPVTSAQDSGPKPPAPSPASHGGLILTATINVSGYELQPGVVDCLKTAYFGALSPSGEAELKDFAEFLASTYSTLLAAVPNASITKVCVASDPERLNLLTLADGDTCIARRLVEPLQRNKEAEAVEFVFEAEEPDSPNCRRRRG